ncbi:MAG: glycosyltransferase family 4 protein [Prevotella sp.]|nr:glycosyltransferase family 4 protein [Prevotella sp.]MCM1476105.1 glycosyltransferase family 4 protein [Muribaculaceae bacterium]
MNVSESGGWIYSSLRELQKHPEMKFAVASPYPGNEFRMEEADGVTYYLLPYAGKSILKYQEENAKYWEEISSAYQPEVVHIHGTEFPFALSYVRSMGSKGVVVSIQGITSVIADHYMAGIPLKDLITTLTPRDIARNFGLFGEQRMMHRRGEYEKELLRSVGNVIGRTDWDKAHVKAINPDICYHYCGESLRPSFYTHKWKYNECRPHSIFVSQGYYPLKGLHKLLEALPLVIRKYSDVRVNVAGSDPTAENWKHLTGYGVYLKRLIAKLGLREKVRFLGILNEEEMLEQYLCNNVSVCPSSIENSPNSIGEAQMLGIPYIGSFVGGIPDITGYSREVLYRYEETEMLAEKLCRIFSKGANVEMPPCPAERYSPERNTRLLTEIYKSLSPTLPIGEGDRHDILSTEF